MDEINWDNIVEVIPEAEVDTCIGSDILTSITSQVELLIQSELSKHFLVRVNLYPY